jgi:hypothetical protein
MAEEVGKKLLAEVEEVGLDEVRLSHEYTQDSSEACILIQLQIFQTLRFKYGAKDKLFNLPPLDRILQIIHETRIASTKQTSWPPIVELMSVAAGGGKTHLLYHLCALAILPTSNKGNQACVVIIDTDNKFDVNRLAKQIRKILLSKSSEYDTTSKELLNEVIRSHLRHVHIFRPQSLASTTATLDSLPEYLLDKNRHYSFDRQVAFIAIDSASAFYWQDRAETVDTAFTASTTTSSTTKQAAQPASGYTHLNASLKAATRALSCPAIVTTWYMGSTPSTSNPFPVMSFRPQLPALQPTFRFVVQRLPVRKFPPGISVEQAHKEAADRRKVVEQGKFEIFVNEWGLEERVLKELGRKGASFEFRIKNDGFSVEDGRG